MLETFTGIYFGLGLLKKATKTLEHLSLIEDLFDDIKYLNIICSLTKETFTKRSILDGTKIYFL